MKKNILLFVLALMLALPAIAQEKESAQPQATDWQHRVYAGYGVLSNSTILSVISHTLIMTITMGGYRVSDMNFSGSFHAGYRYRLGRRFDVGGVYTFGKGTQNVTQGNVSSGHLSNHFHSIAAEGEFRYVDRPAFELYSGLGLGIGIFAQKYLPDNGAVEKKAGAYPDFHIALIGLRAGKRFGGFAEFGFGYKGMFNFGAFAKF